MNSNIKNNKLNKASENCPRVRFAPSPTGNLHIGNFRSALFNWLFAKHNNGTFLVRIEDTDIQRSEQKYIDSIIDALKWTNIMSTEPIIKQSSKLDRHLEIIKYLLEAGYAYKCYCTNQEIEERLNQNNTSNDKSNNYSKYDKKCRYLNKGSNLDDANNYVVRFKLPEDVEKIEFNDLIRGLISFNIDQLDDFIIMRTDKLPTYNLAVVIDDADMNISHVIRGEDHISNTPKQILIYKACNFSIPLFGHLPLILGSSGQKLSKREASVSVLEYKQKGFLPDALCNYLVRLGWSHKDQEIFTRKELIELFTLDNIGKKGAIFDIDKLKWINSIYIQDSQASELLDYITNQLHIDITQNLNNWDNNKIIKVISLYKSRVKTIKELIEDITQLYQDPYALSKKLDILNNKEIKKYKIKDIYDRLCIIEHALYQQSDFSAESIKIIIKNIYKNLNLKLPDVAKPLRVALTGKLSTPSIFEIISILGKEESIKRIEKFRELIEAQNL